MAKDLNVDFNFTGCKYYLPCGKCDKTNELCTHYIPSHPTYPYYPSYPGWWEYGPIWTSNEYKYTTTDHSILLDPDEWTQTNYTK